jgi:uncharacterized SAM-binding protein YcdF (DUF218 family)
MTMVAAASLAWLVVDRSGTTAFCGEILMELWMYLFVIGMFVVSIIGTIWITLWTIQRGERSRATRAEDTANKPE